MHNIPSHEKKFFYGNCCHSATNPPKPLCFKYIPVVAARWEVAAKFQQPHPQPLPEREGSGCAQGEWQQSPTTNPSPKGRGAAARRG